jgi:hypothetical protein
VRIIGDDGKVHSTLDVRDSLALEIEFQVYKEAQLAIVIHFVGALGAYIMASMDNYVNGPWGKQSPYAPGIYKASCHVPGDFLNEGQFSINLWIYSPPSLPGHSAHVKLFNVVSTEIDDRRDPDGARGQFPYEWGIEPAVRPKLKWLTEKIL